MNYKKICIICGEEFIAKSSNASLCSDKCKKIRAKQVKKEWDAKNKEHNKERNKKYRELNPLSDEWKNEKKAYDKKYYLKNKEKKQLQGKEYRKINKDKLKEYRNSRKEYYLQHSREYHKKYYPKNKEKIIKRSSEHKRKKRLEDPSERIRDGISGRLGRAIGGKRGKSSFEYLDYNKDELIKNIITKLKDGMTLENYGYYGWHIDHIKPVAAFKLIKEDGELDLEQIKLCWSLDNLQPLWAKDNMSKGSRCEVDGNIIDFRYNKEDNI